MYEFEYIQDTQKNIQGRYFICIYLQIRMDYPIRTIQTPYQAQKATELSVEIGDLVLVVDDNSSEKWIYGQTLDKTKKGWFPKICVTVDANTKVMIKVPYAATKPTEVTVKVGDQVIVSEKHGDWLYGYMENGSHHGWFPSYCIEPGKNDNNRKLPPMNHNHNDYNNRRNLSINRRNLSINVSNVNNSNKPNGRNIMMSPIAKSREMPSNNFHQRSVSLGGRILNNQPRSFFNDDDVVYGKIIKRANMQVSSNGNKNKNNNRKPMDDYNKTPDCMICNEADVTMLINPCWHAVLCEKCAKTVTNCPKCLKKVLKFQKIFL